MAESVKNNARRRKPPSHLMNDIYSPDQLDSSLNPNLLTKDAGKYASDPYSQTAYARILVKFINKTNKFMKESKAARDQIEASKRAELTPARPQPPLTRQEAFEKQEKTPVPSRASDRNSNKAVSLPAENPKSGQKPSRQMPPPGHSGQSVRQTRSQQQQNPYLKDSSLDVPPSSMEALSRLSEEQFRKFLEQGINPSYFSPHLKINVGGPGVQTNRPQQQPQQPPQQPTAFTHPRELKTDGTKLFKRAAYHVGLAYYIHLEKLKKEQNPNWDIMDPTLISRRLRQANEKEALIRERQRHMLDDQQLRMMQQHHQQMMFHQMQEQQKQEFLMQMALQQQQQQQQRAHLYQNSPPSIFRPGSYPQQQNINIKQRNPNNQVKQAAQEAKIESQMVDVDDGEICPEFEQPEFPVAQKMHEEVENENQNSQNLNNHSNPAQSNQRDEVAATKQEDAPQGIADIKDGEMKE